MTDEKKVTEGEEVIPRKVRDLFGRVNVRLAKIEARLPEQPDDTEEARPSPFHAEEARLPRLDEGGVADRQASKKHKYANPPEEQPVAAEEPEKSEELREAESGQDEKPCGPEESDASSEGNTEAEEKPEEREASHLAIEDVFPEVPLPDDLEAEVERLVEAAVANPFGIQPRGRAQTMEGRGPAQAHAQAVPGNATGASTTPTNPPLAEDPVASADRRAEGVEAQLDARFYGSE
jgi:hypothetical protein